MKKITIKSTRKAKKTIMKKDSDEKSNEETNEKDIEKSNEETNEKDKEKSNETVNKKDNKNIKYSSIRVGTCGLLSLCSIGNWSFFHSDT